MMYHQCPSDLASKLIHSVEMCVGECYWRRRFLLNWRDHGVDTAYSDWIANAPIKFPELLPRVTSTIEEIKKWPSKPFQA